MLSTIFYIWAGLFVLLIIMFIKQQPKLMKFHDEVRTRFPGLLEEFRPGFIFLKYNDQLVFSRFLLKKGYLLRNDNDFHKKGVSCRNMLIVNFCLTIIFFVVTGILFRLRTHLL